MTAWCICYVVVCLQWSKLYDPIVWLEAAAQIFFSLSVAFGAHITYTSYTDPNAKATPLKDTLTVSFINCGTSLFASIVIFSILGFKAKDQGISVEDVSLALHRPCTIDLPDEHDV